MFLVFQLEVTTTVYLEKLQYSYPEVVRVLCWCALGVVVHMVLLWCAHGGLVVDSVQSCRQLSAVSIRADGDHEGTTFSAFSLRTYSRFIWIKLLFEPSYPISNSGCSGTAHCNCTVRSGDTRHEKGEKVVCNGS